MLVDENIKLKVLAGSFDITNLENLSSNPLYDPKAAISTLKILTESRL
jgi:hypothetical protein